MSSIKYQDENGDFIAITPAMIGAADEKLKYIAQTALEIAGAIASTCGCCHAITAQVKKMFSDLAESTDTFIYYDGTIYCPSSKTTVDGTAITFGDTCYVEDNVIILE